MVGKKAASAFFGDFVAELFPACGDFLNGFAANLVLVFDSPVAEVISVVFLTFEFTEVSLDEEISGIAWKAVVRNASLKVCCARLSGETYASRYVANECLTEFFCLADAFRRKYCFIATSNNAFYVCIGSAVSLALAM